MVKYSHLTTIFNSKLIFYIYMSRYSPNYERYSPNFKNFLIVIDVLFLLYYLFLWFLFAKKLKKRMYDLFILKSYSFTFLDYLV